MDRVLIEFDRALRTVFAPAATERPVPGGELPEATLDAHEKAEAAALMRVNHVGEVCAQALYQGQALTARDPAVKRALLGAAREETEHLAWTERRIAELGGRKSLLNPLWYAGAWAVGVVAGAAGERWNLGFVAETERQVEAHLNGHMARLPVQDLRSRAIVEQMKDDEVRHADMAVSLGAYPLPRPVSATMRLAAKFMTSVAHRI